MPLLEETYYKNGGLYNDTDGVWFELNNKLYGPFNSELEAEEQKLLLQRTLKNEELD